MVFAHFTNLTVLARLLGLPFPHPYLVSALSGVFAPLGLRYPKTRPSRRPIRPAL